MRRKWLFVLLATGLVLNGCAGSGKYIGTDQIDEVTPGMSDTDVKLLAGTIIESLLSSNFIGRYEKPVTISMLEIVNSTSEFINTDGLIGEMIISEIINSGSGTFEFVDRSLLNETIADWRLTGSWIRTKRPNWAGPRECAY